jgi:hypothetical protein
MNREWMNVHHPHRSQTQQPMVFQRLKFAAKTLELLTD